MHETNVYRTILGGVSRGFRTPLVICLAGAFTKSEMENISTLVLIAENISTKLIGMTIE